MTKFEKRLKSFPPFWVRLCARSPDGKNRLTRREISKRSKLPGRTIDRLSRSKSWDNVTLRVAFAFTEACGIDLMNLRGHKDYLKRMKHVAWKQNPNVYGRLLAKIISV